MNIENLISDEILHRCETILVERRDPEWFVDRETILLILNEALLDLLPKKE